MSEYQWVEFMAVDAPVAGKDLEFMQQQSSRAEVTPWRFTNEYHFGDFHGNALEMLRRGYDLHFHFANFGTRMLMVRLPTGLPCDSRSFRKYEVDHAVMWKKDPRGKAGVLTILPEGDAGSFDYLLNVNLILQQLAPIREMLIQGDLRPLFLGWLACCWDPEADVPPIPAGLNERNEALDSMLDLYELDDALIDVVAAESLPLPEQAEHEVLIDRWLAKQKKADLEERLREILSDNASTARNRLLRDIRAGSRQQAWPTTKVKMRVSDLRGDG